MRMSCSCLIWATIALAGLGIACGQKPTPSPQTGATNSTAATSSLSAAASATRKEYVTDPSLNNMNAAEFIVPAKWHLQATLAQGGNCITTPFLVFRGTSPDGLAFFEQMPGLGWVWGTGQAPNPNQSDCLPLKQAMGAQDFLKYISATLQVEYLADERLPADTLAAARKSETDVAALYAPQYAAMHITPPKTTRELARATVRYRNGTFVMRGRLDTAINCSETQRRIPTMRGEPQTITEDRCTAFVDFSAAPESQYQATVNMLDARNIGPTMLPAWQQAWLDRSRQQTAQAIDRMNTTFAEQREAGGRQFAHDQGVRQQMHEEFLSTMQRGTDMSMNRAAQVANSNHTIASDWVDYSLNQQTVRDPNTGQINKVSSANSYTWTDNSGKTSFQTNDPNANPNGTLQGNWTRRQQVHGDGTIK